jgi:hypothetical protein
MASHTRKYFWEYLREIVIDRHQTQGIDDVHRATAKATDPAVEKEGKQLVADLAKLKYELQHDRALTYV